MPKVIQKAIVVRDGRLADGMGRLGSCDNQKAGGRRSDDVENSTCSVNSATHKDGRWMQADMENLVRDVRAQPHRRDAFVGGSSSRVICTVTGINIWGGALPQFWSPTSLDENL